MIEKPLRPTYMLRVPGKYRKSFSIMSRVRCPDGKEKYSKFESESLTSINKALHEGRLNLESAHILAKEALKKAFSERDLRYPKAVENAQNKKLMNEYWKAEYEHRDLANRASAVNDLKRAMRAVDNLSLYTASREEIQREVSKYFKGTKQRRIIGKLNSVLKFIGRSLKLTKDRPVQRRVAYLTLDDFKKVVLNIEDPRVRLLAEVAFSTGCRLGEAFAIIESAIRDKHVFVENQIDRYTQRRQTKNRKVRRAFILQGFREKVYEWSLLKNKNSFRGYRFATLIKNACFKAFPDQPEKWITFHDLRHSYAIHLLSKGVGLSLVATSLGNTVSVCQDYYVGYVLTDEAIESIARQMDKHSDIE